MTDVQTIELTEEHIDRYIREILAIDDNHQKSQLSAEDISRLYKNH
ncbi:hypothetical protein [Candidatus Coxiella mudrowiae]|nr:hypothetical protein [Candidatus Coxiella mudrowiae]